MVRDSYVVRVLETAFAFQEDRMDSPLSHNAKGRRRTSKINDKTTIH